MAVPLSAKATLATPLSSEAVAAHAAAVPLIVAPAFGALKETVGAALTGAGGVVLPPLFCTLMAIKSERVAPELSVATALSECVPFESLVVSSAHCMPSAGVVSVLTALPSIEKATLRMLPEAAT